MKWCLWISSAIEKVKILRIEGVMIKKRLPYHDQRIPDKLEMDYPITTLLICNMNCHTESVQLMRGCDVCKPAYSRYGSLAVHRAGYRPRLPSLAAWSIPVALSTITWQLAVITSTIDWYACDELWAKISHNSLSSISYGRGTARM